MGALDAENEIRKRFEERGIPYDELDTEMIEILNILNFELNIETKFCCYGHKKGETTYIMFDESESDENVIKILKAVDGNVGTSRVEKIKLFKWARRLYQPYYKKPHWTQMNWILEIDYVEEEKRKERLAKVTKALRELADGVKSI